MKFGKKRSFFFFSPHSTLLSSQQLLVEYFPVYLSIICASSGRPLSHYVLHLWSKCLLEMSHHKRPVKGRCYYQSAIHSQPSRDESITFKKSSAERERPFFGHLLHRETRPFYQEPEKALFFFFF